MNLNSSAKTLTEPKPATDNSPQGRSTFQEKTNYFIVKALVTGLLPMYSSISSLSTFPSTTWDHLGTAGLAVSKVINTEYMKINAMKDIK